MGASSSRKKQQLTSLSDDEPIHQIKITDITPFILETIFLYLDFEDLLSIADTNKQLRLASFVPFSRRLANRTIHLYPNRYAFETSTTNIQISNLKQIFQILRSFGHLITKLEYSGLYNPNHYRIINYLNEYCSEYLIELTISKYFKNAPITYPHTGRISNLFTETIDFLKLNNLKFCDKMPYERFVLGHFSNLNVFKFCDSAANDEIAPFLRLNPQVKWFKIKLNDFDFLHSLTDLLQTIETLEIETCIDYRPQITPSIHLPNVKKFAIDFHGNQPGLIMPSIPLLFDQLKEFSLCGVSTKYSTSFHKFLSQNSSIERIEFKQLSGADFSQAIKLQSVLPYLKEINFARFFLWTPHGFDAN